MTPDVVIWPTHFTLRDLRAEYAYRTSVQRWAWLWGLPGEDFERLAAGSGNPT
ncbi:MAG TPA: hypothetical protein VGP44_05660 [Gemmatimonadales bacterium]|nr:hypothetical protein [Gemmatimonadales bacterium]